MLTSAAAAIGSRRREWQVDACDRVPQASEVEQLKSCLSQHRTVEFVRQRNGLPQCSGIGAGNGKRADKMRTLFLLLCAVVALTRRVDSAETVSPVTGMTLVLIITRI